MRSSIFNLKLEEAVGNKGPSEWAPELEEVES